MYKAYIRIYGAEFNAEGFAGFTHLEGKVGVTKELVGNEVITKKSYWRTKEVHSEQGHAESDLLPLLEAVNLELHRAKIGSAVRVLAHIVQDVGKHDVARGLYLSKPVVAALARVGAEFDFDISRICEFKNESD